MSDETMLRAATTADSEAVLGLMRQQAREETPGFPFAYARAKAAFDANVSRGAVIVACDEDDRPIGSAAIRLECPYWSERPWLLVEWCYVRPSHRRGPHMRELLAAARAAAGTAGAPLRLDCAGAVKGKTGLLRRELGDAAGAIFLLAE